YLAPAEPTGHIDVGGYFLARVVEVLAHRAHTRWVSITRVLVRRRYVVAGVGRKTVVTARFVIDRTNDRSLAHPPRHARQVFADLNSGCAGRRRPKFAADTVRGLRLQIKHVLRCG